MSSRPNFALSGEDPQHYALSSALTYIWDVPTLSWVKNTGGGGGGGGAVTIADGADVAQGAKADAAWVAGDGTVISLLKKIASAGGSAVSIADGADVVEGALADAAIITDTTGTVNGKLRGLVKHAFERMPAALGQTTMAASLPIAIASNQSAVPVSGPLTDTQLRATPVPVSGTVTTSPPANASTNLAQIVGTAADVNSGVKSAGTLRVVLATDQPALTNKLLVTPDSVALPANQSVNAAQFGGTNVVTGTGAGGVGIPRVTVSNDSNVIVTPPTLTKGTQGATGFSAQDLKDAGRTAISFYANNFASGATTVEKIITWDQSKGTGAITAATASYTITNGKTLRITGLSVATRGNAVATVQSTVFSLRLNTAGAAVVTSTPILFAAQSATAAVASAWDRVIIPIPDGYEIAGNGTISFCMTGNSTFVTNAPTWAVNLIGFEY